MKTLLRVLVICLLATWAAPAWALADDFYECESIVVGEFAEYKTDHAVFYAQQVLKGPPFGGHIIVCCPRPARATVKSGSKWILFIKVAVPEQGLFKTYKGLDGLRPRTLESEAQYRQELSEYEKRTSGKH